VIEASESALPDPDGGRTLRDALRLQLAARASRPKPEPPIVASSVAPAPVTILSTLDLGQRVDVDRYREQLEDAQGRLNLAARRAQKKGIPSVIVYEGVDAAGKGGNIRRVTGALDARMYRIVPVAAPSDEERRQPYLWRFWRHLPRAGRMTIFDRSWYGRVLVERVEGFCSSTDWQRAYGEINEFEEQLARHGVVLVKFLAPHRPGRAAPAVRRSAGPSGSSSSRSPTRTWRNRERWPLYDQAVNEMVERTSTEVAPWTLVEANDKRFARLKTLETLAAALENG